MGLVIAVGPTNIIPNRRQMDTLQKTTNTSWTLYTAGWGGCAKSSTAHKAGSMKRVPERGQNIPLHKIQPVEGASRADEVWQADCQVHRGEPPLPQVRKSIFCKKAPLVLLIIC